VVDPNANPPEWAGVQRLHFLVEGQTEETIARDLIVPHFEARDWSVSVSILTTKRSAGQPTRRGGVSNWSRILRDIRLLLSSQFDVLTTIIDYYACPSDTPGMPDRPTGDPRRGVEHVEAAMAAAVNHRCFLPNLVLHETEAWVLAAVEDLGVILGDPAGAAALRKTVDESGGAELVDDGPLTAPSKRLTAQWPAYQKTFDGPYALLELGLAGLRRQCPHLDAWLATIERWPGS
jgi:hypothetical protein